MTTPKEAKTDMSGFTLNLTVTQDDFDRAQTARSHSGRCMIAQAITAKYGKESRPIVDSDFIRITNPENGDRLFFRTSPEAAAALISFDAGIAPTFPIKIRSRAVFQRKYRAREHAPAEKMREWARTQPDLAEKVDVDKPVTPEIAAAYRKEHPGVVTSHSRQPRVKISQASQPPSGNITNSANPAVPQSRRRTWGSRRLTAELVKQGWVIPDGM